MKLQYIKSGHIAKLKKVASPLSYEDILAAVDKFNKLGGEVDSYADSVGYDLIVDDKRYPPKAIFGLALSKLVKTKILSSHFKGGDKSECFAVFRELGFEIVRKGAPQNEIPLTGQGRVVDAQKKKAVELHAMTMAQSYYESQGYRVKDTSSNKPYDLECRKGNERRRVEVKGTMSKGAHVLVTSNEVDDAKSNVCETDLFIAFNIQVSQSEQEYVTQGNEFRLIANWKPKQTELVPKTFEYHLPKDQLRKSQKL